MPKVARLLIGETIYHESGGLNFLGQWLDPVDNDPDGFGPGLGIASVEGGTYIWLVKEIAKKKEWRDAFKVICGVDPLLTWHQSLIGNLPMNVALVRWRYWFVKEKLPTLVSGIPGRASYWRRYYNAAPKDYSKAYMNYAERVPWMHEKTP